MDNKKYLENFLLDIDILEELKEFTNDVNIFDVLKITNAELKHSIVLSYIFNPNENHGLGLRPLELFFKKLSSNEQIKQLKIFDLLDIDYSDFDIMREYKNIDILMKSSKNKIVVCIENKIWTGEHGNQLNRYKLMIDDEYEDYKKIYLYLTPDGEEASDNENWINISYKDILEIIDDLNLDNTSLNIKMLIEDYKSIIRRKIMNDNELKELCNKIYKKHKQALDLIYENKMDDSYYLYSIINEYLIEKAEKNEICYNEKNSTKTYLRFTTPYLNNIFPLLDENISSWRNKNTVFYEVVIEKKDIRVQISFGYKGVDKKNRYDEASTYFNNIKLKELNFNEKGAYLVNRLKGKIDIANVTFDYQEYDREYIFKELDKIILPVLKQEKQSYAKA